MGRIKLDGLAIELHGPGMTIQLRQHAAQTEGRLRILRTLPPRDRVTGECRFKFFLRGEHIAEFNPAFGQAGAYFYRLPE